VEYNGWTNYETWLLKLNLDNDYGTYTAVQEWFDDADTTDINEHLHQLVDSFKDWLEELFFIEEHNIIKICDTWTWRDWQDINFTEVVNAYLEG
jgi:hypothetical protein